MANNLTITQYATVAAFTGLAVVAGGIGALGLFQAFNAAGTVTAATIAGNSLAVAAGGLSAQIAYNTYTNQPS